MNKLRLELRVKNLALWNAIHQTDGSVYAFCRNRGFQHRDVEVGRLLNLRGSPYSKAGDLTSIAKWLCSETGIGADELFPPELYSKLLPQSVFVAEVSADRLLSLDSVRALPMPESLEETFEKRDLEAALIDGLKKLPHRERYVLTKRFGLDGEEPLTVQEISGRISVSRETTRQLELKAIDRLCPHLHGR